MSGRWESIHRPTSRAPTPLISIKDPTPFRAPAPRGGIDGIDGLDSATFSRRYAYGTCRCSWNWCGTCLGCLLRRFLILRGLNRGCPGWPSTSRHLFRTPSDGSPKSPQPPLAHHGRVDPPATKRWFVDCCPSKRVATKMRENMIVS